MSMELSHAMEDVVILTVFWDVASCGFVINRRFGGTRRLCLHVEEMALAKKSVRRLITD
jgi:hypothetical protein